MHLEPIVGWDDWSVKVLDCRPHQVMGCNIAVAEASTMWHHIAIAVWHAITCNDRNGMAFWPQWATSNTAIIWICKLPSLPKVWLCCLMRIFYHVPPRLISFVPNCWLLIYFYAPISDFGLMEIICVWSVKEWDRGRIFESRHCVL